MVVETKKIPWRDLKGMLPPGAYKRRMFNTYYAERHDTSEYSILRKPSFLGRFLVIVLFVPAFLFYFVQQMVKVSGEIISDLASEWNNSERSISIKAKGYFK